jgi:hypothetical protein
MERSAVGEKFVRAGARTFRNENRLRNASAAQSRSVYSRTVRGNLDGDFVRVNGGALVRTL